MSSEKALHNVGNVDIARRLVESVELRKRKKFILSVDESQCTALHRAVEKEKTDVVEYLCSLSLANDELILKKDANGWTALHYAENREIAKLLVDSVLPENQNAFTLCADEDQCTALHIAAGISKTYVVEYLCSLSIADELILKKDSNGCTALHYAKNREIAWLLVESVLLNNENAFILSMDEDQCTALHAAAEAGRADVVEYLCSLSLPDDELILKKDANGRTALHYAQNREIAKILVESVLPENTNAFILSVDRNQHTVLHKAAMSKKTQVVEYLCSFAELSVPLIFRKDCLNSTAMHFATNKKIVSYMLSSVQYVQINELLSDINTKGNTPILSLVEFGQHKSLAELLQHISKKDIRTYLEQKNYDDQNILHLAARSLSLGSMYRVLQDYVRDLNFKNMMHPDVYGNTPIHYVSAKYETKVFADFMLQLSLPMRHKIANTSNSKLVDCRKILNRKAFDEQFYINKVLADDNHESLVSKFAGLRPLMRNYEQLTQSEMFYKYDETILKVLKYCLNEYSLLDSAYTTSHSLFLSAANQHKFESSKKVSRYVKSLLLSLNVFMHFFTKSKY